MEKMDFGKYRSSLPLIQQGKPKPNKKEFGSANSSRKADVIHYQNNSIGWDPNASVDSYESVKPREYYLS
jgi:hypothetical protein